MTRVFSGTGLALWLLAGAAMNAADVWESKPYNTWTDVELKQVLTNSPWAGKGAISYIRTQGASSPAIEETAVVLWSSALPIRQGTVREQIAPGTPIPPDVDAALAQPLPAYMIAIKVTGASGSAGYARSIAAMQAETFLLRDDKPPIAAVQSEGRVLDKEGKVVETPPAAPAGGFGPPRGGGAPPGGPALSVQQRGGGGGGFPGGGRGGFGAPGGVTSLLIFAFPKTDPITLADKEVELVTKLCAPSFGRGGPGGACQYNLKKKFKLKDMVVKGELVL